MKINGVWYLDSMPNHAVVELEDGKLFKFFISPFRKITKEELSKGECVYNGYHPNKCSSQCLPSYLYKFYGFEGPKNSYTWLTTVEVEKTYGLPKGSVRRDIHRQKFQEHEIKKAGRDWNINMAAADRMYGK
jgi:hypothetical protein